jgi:hypothetical protein
VQSGEITRKHPFGMLMIRIFKILNVLSLDYTEFIGSRVDNLFQLN